MSRNSQAKRAARAKQRSRRRAQERHPVGGSDQPFADVWADLVAEAEPLARPTEPDRALQLLRSVGRTHPTMIINELTAISPAVVYDIAGRYLLSCLREAYGHGWLPVELVRQAKLRGDAATSDLARWLVGAERAVDGLASVDQHWRRQYEAAEPPALGTDERWVDRWARSRRLPDPATVPTLVRLLDLLVHLPAVELLVQPPPGIRTGKRVLGVAAADGNPILTKVRALLAKAESTAHEAEAAAFTGKAHELITRHAIDVATLQHAGQRDPGRPAVIRVPVDPPYPDAKALLLQTVAEQTRCKALFHKELQLSTVIGYPADLEAVDLLFTSLLVQAQQALARTAAGSAPGSRSRSVGFRAAFLVGFAGRIGERLAEVNRLTFADRTTGSFLPVLRSQEERVTDFMETELGGRTVQSTVRGGYDAYGYQHGVLAGDAAELTSGVVRS